MKASAMTITSLRRLFTIAVVAAAASLKPAAFAQRESFDATVVKPVSTILEQLAAAEARERRVEILIRMGMSPDGKRTKVSATKTALTFDKIYFEFDSTKLRDTASALLVQEMAAALKSKKYRDRHWLIEGHTCQLGEADYNLKLSAGRAQVVKDYLVRQGIPAEHLAVLGFGKEEPVFDVPDTDRSSAAERKREQNRRVVLRLLPEPSDKPAKR